MTEIPTFSSGAIALYDKINDPMQAVNDLGQVFASSGLFGCTKKEQGVVLALACLAERKSPFELMRTYHLIDGKLEMKATAMLARFMELGGKCKWMSDLANCEFAKAHWVSPDGINEFEAEYTIHDAKREGLSDRKNWKQSAPDMLRARLMAKVIRMICPQINAGIYDQLEMADQAVDTTPKTLLPVPDPKPSAEKLAAEKPAPSPVVTSPKTVEAEVVTEATPSTPPPDSSNEVRSRLAELLTPIEADANEFLVAKSYVKVGETFRDVSDEMAVKIVNNSGHFKLAIDNFKTNLAAAAAAAGEPV